MRGHGEVWRRCQELIDDLAIPTPFDLQQLCTSTGLDRGRPIHLALAAMPLGSPCGLWIATDDEDIIVVEKHTTRLHRVHAALHELGHILQAGVQHPGEPGQARPDPGAHAVHRLVPEVGPDTIRRTACRTTYDDLAEYEAELFASLVLQRVGGLVPAPAWPPPPPAVAAAADRVTRTLAASHA
jgi:hypothetical protein